VDFTDPDNSAGNGMERITGYLGAMVASAIGWQIGRFGGPVVSFLLAVIGAGLGLYYTRRLIRDFFES
jgi:uncharacterized membrane protein YeaQ/YmgE (transglycosylase-associated protein family)